MNKRKVKIEINKQLKELQDMMMSRDTKHKIDMSGLLTRILAIEVFLRVNHPDVLSDMHSVSDWNKKRNEKFDWEKEVDRARRIVANYDEHNPPVSES